MATEKKKHWQNVVYEPSGVTPGVYDRPVLTIDEFGFVTNAAPSSIPTQTVIPTIGDLGGITGMNTGDLAIVLNLGGTEEEEMYVYNAGNTDLGAPLGKWRLLASTELATAPMNFRNEIIGNMTLINNVGAPLPLSAKIKAVHATIISTYDPGITLQVRENTGGTWLFTTDVNAQLAGTYSRDWASNNGNMVFNGQLEAVLSGASPGGGSALIYVEYIIQP